MTPTKTRSTTGLRPRSPRQVQPLETVQGDGLLQRETVLAYTGFGATLLDDLMAEGGFPRPIKLLPSRCVRWHAPAVRAWVANKVGAAA